MLSFGGEIKFSHEEKLLIERGMAEHKELEEFILSNDHLRKVIEFYSL